MKNNDRCVKIFIISLIMLGYRLPVTVAAPHIDVEMRLNDGGFVSYDHFKAELYMNNSDSLTPGATIFGILEVLGEFFFWPSFSSDVDFEFMDIQPGDTVVVFLEFDFENIDDFIPFGPMTFWGAWFLDMESWNYDFQEFWLDSAHKWTPTPIPTDTPMDSTPTSTPTGSMSTETPVPSPTNIPTDTPTSTPTPTPPPVVGAVFIPPGEFDMGSPDTEPCRQANEILHHVSLTRGFYMWENEASRYLWKILKQSYPSILPDDPTNVLISPTDSYPAQNCTWHEAVLFANLSSIYSGNIQCYYKDEHFTIPVDNTNYSVGDFYCNFDADGWRLPTEAEWEYACRAGRTGPFSCDEPNYNTTTCNNCDPGKLPTLEAYSKFCANNNGWLGSVGSKLPNPWGLHDMHGNVLEWCWDWYGDYPTGSVTDPTGFPSGDSRVVRGGWYSGAAHWMRSAFHLGFPPFFRAYNLGFRLVSTYNPGAPTPTPAPTSPPYIPHLVYFAPGIFTMGSPEDEPCTNVEIQHQVRLTNGFYMMDSEVTRLMWSNLQSQQPSLPKDPSDVTISPTNQHAVQDISWNLAVLYANLSSIEDGIKQCYFIDPDYATPVDATNYKSDTIYWNREADGWRLPTEAEWEYACRARTTGAFSCDEPLYDTGNCGLCVLGTHPTLELYCWYCANSSGTSGIVGTKIPNPRGLYDMHGNVCEWCWDWHDDYPSEPTIDPSGPTIGVYKVIRGGAWLHPAKLCRSASRHKNMPAQSTSFTGFRLVRTVF